MVAFVNDNILCTFSVIYVTIIILASYTNVRRSWLAVKSKIVDCNMFCISLDRWNNFLIKQIIGSVQDNVLQHLKHLLYTKQIRGRPTLGLAQSKQIFT